MSKYIAFLYKDSEIDKKYEGINTGFNVVIPDVEGAFTCGDDIEHSIKMAKDVLKFSLEDLVKEPKANDINYFTDDKLKELDIPLTAISKMIEVKVRQEKKTISVKLSLKAKEIIDDYVKAHHMTRSDFLERSALQVAMAN